MSLLRNVTQKGLTQGLSTLQTAFSTVAANIPAASAIQGTIESARTTALNEMSSLQSVIPTLPTTLNTIRNLIPSIQAAYLNEGLNDLEKVTGGLSSIPNTIFDNGDLSADLNLSPEMISAFGNVQEKVRDAQSQVENAATNIQDLKGGLGAVLNSMPGIPRNINRDILGAAISKIPNRPLVVSQTDEPKSYNFTKTSYSYRPIL